MPKLLFCFLLIAGASGPAFAQQGSVSGSVTDTANQKKLANAVISIVNKTDSTLIKFTRADKDGKFSIKGIDTGAVLLIISYPRYADYVDQIQVAPGSDLALGEINLINKSQLLNEIVIRQNNAMRIKGDTLEYTADSFKVRPNANVEDLLKVMPGIQVDKDGKIVAQGQQVQKVLVDGEEFFSDDPTIATRNIRADAVDKVQVYDKKSDQAEFTGIDDGEKTKTVNLKLKEDKKNGYFGKLSAAGGLKDKYSNEAMVNYFKGKKKFSAYGIMSNTGQSGLSWQDRRKYSGGDNFEYDEDNGFFYSMGGVSSFDYRGDGLPRVWTGGAHFSNKWNEDKFDFNSNYLFKKMNILSESSTRSQSILPDTTYFHKQKSSSFSQRLRHSLDGKYDWKIDSSSSLKITFDGYKGRSQTNSKHYSEALNDDLGFVNNSTREMRNETDEASLNTAIIWRKKFKKKGRTISVRTEQRYNNTDREGYLGANNHYFDADGTIIQKDTINQKKYNHSQLLTLNGKATYTEPITKDNFIQLNYGYSNTNSSADRRTFDYANGKYDQVNDLLTNDYDFLIKMHAAGLAYRITKKKYNLSIGGDIVHQSYSQEDKIAETELKYNRTNLFPKANFNYRFKPQTSLYLSYSGATVQPTIQQIQPIRENEDPLNIFIGNPDIKPAFSNNFSLYFNDYKVLKERYFYANAGANLINNSITTRDNVDKAGKRVYQSVNTGDTYNYYSYVGYNLKVASIKTRFDVNLGANGNKFINIVNDVQNITNNSSYSFSTGGYYSIENKFGFNLSASAAYNRSVSSIRKDVKTKYWIYSGNIDTYVALPFKMDLNSDARFNFRQKTSVFDQNRNAILWNASLSKRLFKETCSLKFAVNDILNQNIGFNRNISSNFVSENTYLTLRRFWLVSFTWNFTKNNATVQNP